MNEKMKLSEKIKSVDLNYRNLWDSLDEVNQKALKGEMFILNRYISNVKSNSTEVQSHFVITVNEYYNKNWFLLSKEHSKLLWLLLCMCNHKGKTYFHEWIGNKKKDGNNNNKKIQFLAELNPAMKMSEVEMLATIMPAKELAKLAKAHGFDDSEINKQLK